MAETHFSDLGRVEAIRQLYEGTPFKPFVSKGFTASAKSTVVTAARLFAEGVDFNLVYFPLKHLGYKCVTAVTGELLAAFSHPQSLQLRLGVSAKLDFDEIRQLWEGAVAAAREQGYAELGLDLSPSPNGLCISVSACGETPLLSARRRPAPKTKDLLCVSGNLGAAYLGLQLLERGRTQFEAGQELPDLEQYRLFAGSYLKPELDASVVARLEEAEIYPSAGVFVARGLADAVKTLVRDTGLGAKLYVDHIPFEGNSFELGRKLDIDPVSAACNGGDDCRLLFTVPILALERFRRDFQTFSIIGHLAQSEVGAVLVTTDGAELPLRAQGWNEADE